MTALRYGKPMQSALRKAGGIFGLDLAGLFEEDDEALSDFAPGVEFEKTTKGKGGGLYMRPQPVTGETTRLQLLPRSAQVQLPSEININLPAPPIKELEEQVEEEDPVLKEYFGAVGGVGIEDIGLKGFGMKDYNAAIDAGYDPESIKKYVMENKANLYNIGPDAQKKLGIEGYVSTTPGVFDYSEFGGTGFGMKDVEALEARGVSEADMKKLAQQAPNVGPEAAARFGISVPASPPPAPVEYSRPSGPSATPVTGYGLGKGDGSGFNYGAFGGGGFGMEDVRALQSRGASQADMKRIAQSAPGGQIGPEARRILGL
tara:strand:- start:1244 stop:2194 length:951 start_codon:yes stop_codon:yes gene_type:complete